MGIQGLLPALKSVMNPIHVKELAGDNVAVDTSSWLHKGAFSCSRELCHGLSTQRSINTHCAMLSISSISAEFISDFMASLSIFRQEPIVPS